jgi:hypothetical protein
MIDGLAKRTHLSGMARTRAGVEIGLIHSSTQDGWGT